MNHRNEWKCLPPLKKLKQPSLALHLEREAVAEQGVNEAEQNRVPF
jgi:hypothetical protein